MRVPSALRQNRTSCGGASLARTGRDIPAA
jgi:hypothetical protein